MAANTQTLLETELRTRARQRDQYVLAAEVSADSRACVKHLLNVERIEDEIEGIRTALASLAAERASRGGVPDPIEDDVTELRLEIDESEEPRSRWATRLLASVVVMSGVGVGAYYWLGQSLGL